MVTIAYNDVLAPDHVIAIVYVHWNGEVRRQIGRLEIKRDEWKEFREHLDGAIDFIWAFN